MNIMIFDTETTSINKPFCYNIGYVIVNTDDFSIVKTADYVVEQIWHNLPLFSTAYYSEKRPIYISRMKSKKVIMDKFGYICRKMYNDIKSLDVKYAFAYNSPFDEKVFNFNCSWFKCINPFNTIPIKDIRGFAHNFIVDDNYKTFCKENSLFTESGNYSTTAESVYQYITNNIDFIEEHTALNDSLIETEILKNAVLNGANLEEEYKVLRSIENDTLKTLQIEKDKTIIYSIECKNITYYKTKNLIRIK